MIEVESRKHGPIAIRPVGNLDWQSAQTLRHVVDDLFRLRAQFVIDLARTDRVDATGASALLGTMRRSLTLGVDVQVLNPKPAIRLKLERMNLDRLILCPDLDTGDGAA